jgi:hypothetical protein
VATFRKSCQQYCCAIGVSVGRNHRISNFIGIGILCLGRNHLYRPQIPLRRKIPYSNSGSMIYGSLAGFKVSFGEHFVVAKPLLVEHDSSRKVRLLGIDVHSSFVAAITCTANHILCRERQSRQMEPLHASRSSSRHI